MVVNVDQNFVASVRRFSEYVWVTKSDQVKRPFGQAVATKRERLRIEKITVNAFDPTGFAANIPGRAQVPRPVLEFDFDPITRFKLAGRLVHGRPHLESNSASLPSKNIRWFSEPLQRGRGAECL